MQSNNSKKTFRPETEEKGRKRNSQKKQAAAAGVAMTAIAVILLGAGIGYSVQRAGKTESISLEEMQNSVSSALKGEMESAATSLEQLNQNIADNQKKLDEVNAQLAQREESLLQVETIQHRLEENASGMTGKVTDLEKTTHTKVNEIRTDMEYYMQLLTALYEADQEAYALTQLTDSECRSILAETIARVNLVWWEDETEKTEDEGFPGLSPSAVLDRFVKWGWLSKDFDEKLNCYIIGFPEYSRLYVELFDRLEKEDDSMERESILSVYSALYTYDSDPEKNNSILKSALRTSKSLGQMLSNMQDSMRLWFDELSKRKDFIGIQEVLVNEINNRESVKYAILTTTDSFYRYKEAVKELIAKILEENENRREGLTVQKRMLMAAQGSDSSAPEPSESAGGSYAASMQAKALASGASAPALLRLERGIQFCEEAAQLVLLVEREFDLIEKKYNRLIELKTVFARRALARIHYLLQEGAGVEDSTLELIGLLNHSDKKEALLEELRDSMYVTAPFSIVGDASLYNRRPRLENQFVPLALQEEASSEIADFVPKPLYTGRQLEEFRRRHTKNGVFQVLEDTVQSAEDLEKLLFIWQEATQSRQEEDRILLQEEIHQKDGFSYTGFSIDETEN